MNVKSILAGVDEEWLDIFLSDDLCDVLCGCLEKIKPDIKKLKPAPCDLFNAFRYTPFNKLRVVIIGQDPYYTVRRGRNNAHGLSFSTPKENRFIPPSLKNIYAALVKSGHMESTPKHGCLLQWARQGVLMLNLLLSTTDKPLQHTHWSEFTELLIENICARAQHKLIFVMWGRKAQAVSHLISREHIKLTWMHPSPMANRSLRGTPRHFSNCDHFTKINEILAADGGSPIVWDLDTRVVVFTDGGCVGNGEQSAQARYGVYFPQNYLERKNPIMFETSGPITHNDELDLPPTNNRAELTAIIKALEIIIAKGFASTSILLVTDSEYCKNIITKWIQKWQPKFKGKKNPDLLDTLWQRLQAIDKECLIVKHVNSHKAEPARDPDVKTGGEEYELWTGNNAADRLASQGI